MWLDFNSSSWFCSGPRKFSNGPEEFSLFNTGIGGIVRQKLGRFQALIGRSGQRCGSEFFFSGPDPDLAVTISCTYTRTTIRSPINPRTGQS